MRIVFVSSGGVAAEPQPVPIEPRERIPHGARRGLQLRCHQLEQPRARKRPERRFGRIPIAESCSTPRAAAQATPSRSVPRCSAMASSDQRVHVEAQARRHHRRRAASAPDPRRSARAGRRSIGRPPLEVVQAADVVDHRVGRDVVEQPVDREVAAERVFLRRAERVVAMLMPWSEAPHRLVARRQRRSSRCRRRGGDDDRFGVRDRAPRSHVGHHAAGTSRPRSSLGRT